MENKDLKQKTNLEQEVQTEQAQAEAQGEQTAEQTTEQNVESAEASEVAAEQTVSEQPEVEVVVEEPAESKFVAELAHSPVDTSGTNVNPAYLTALASYIAHVKEQTNETLASQQPVAKEVATAIATVVSKLKAYLEVEEVDHNERLLAYIAKVEESKRVYERAKAEYDRAEKYAGDKLIKSVIKPLIETLTLARARLPQDTNNEKFDLLRAELDKFDQEIRADLAKEHIEIFGKVGEEFDPNQHEAVSQMPAMDQEQSGKIAYVAGQGYRLHDRVIVPAMVMTFL